MNIDRLYFFSKIKLALYNFLFNFVDNKEYWGFHMILDLKSCDTSKIKDGKNIEAFVKELVKRIDMKAYGEPTIQYFAEHDINKAGYSLVQLIETSSITGHFVDKNGDSYIDIFSCKPYSLEDAIDVCCEYFDPKNIRIKFFFRKA